MKIDIYTLLGMIKDNKAPKKIMYKDYVFNEEEDSNYIVDYFSSNYGYLFYTTCITSILNGEVTILETTLNTKDMNINTLDNQNYFVINDRTSKIEIIDKIEKINDILRVDDLEPPYDCNLQKIWCQTIKNHNKINEIIEVINEENREDR